MKENTKRSTQPKGDRLRASANKQNRQSRRFDDDDYGNAVLRFNGRMKNSALAEVQQHVLDWHPTIEEIFIGFQSDKKAAGTFKTFTHYDEGKRHSLLEDFNSRVQEIFQSGHVNNITNVDLAKFPVVSGFVKTRIAENTDEYVTVVVATNEFAATVNVYYPWGSFPLPKSHTKNNKEELGEEYLDRLIQQHATTNTDARTLTQAQTVDELMTKHAKNEITRYVNHANPEEIQLVNTIATHATNQNNAFRRITQRINRDLAETRLDDSRVGVAKTAELKTRLNVLTVNGPTYQSDVHNFLTRGKVALLEYGKTQTSECLSWFNYGFWTVASVVAWLESQSQSGNKEFIRIADSFYAARDAIHAEKLPRLLKSAMKGNDEFGLLTKANNASKATVIIKNNNNDDDDEFALLAGPKRSTQLTVSNVPAERRAQAEVDTYNENNLASIEFNLGGRTMQVAANISSEKLENQLDYTALISLCNVWFPLWQIHQLPAITGVDPKYHGSNHALAHCGRKVEIPYSQESKTFVKQVATKDKTHPTVLGFIYHSHHTFEGQNFGPFYGNKSHIQQTYLFKNARMLCAKIMGSTNRHYHERVVKLLLVIGGVEQNPGWLQAILILIICSNVLSIVYHGDYVTIFGPALDSTFLLVLIGYKHIKRDVYTVTYTEIPVIQAAIERQIQLAPDEYIFYNTRHAQVVDNANLFLRYDDTIEIHKTEGFNIQFYARTNTVTEEGKTFQRKISNDLIPTLFRHNDYNEYSVEIFNRRLLRDDDKADSPPYCLADVRVSTIHNSGSNKEAHKSVMYNDIRIDYLNRIFKCGTEDNCYSNEVIRTYVNSFISAGVNAGTPKLISSQIEEYINILSVLQIILSSPGNDNGQLVSTSTAIYSMNKLMELSTALIVLLSLSSATDSYVNYLKIMNVPNFDALTWTQSYPYKPLLYPRTELGERRTDQYNYGIFNFSALIYEKLSNTPLNPSWTMSFHAPLIDELLDLDQDFSNSFYGLFGYPPKYRLAQQNPIYYNNLNWYLWCKKSMVAASFDDTEQCSVKVAPVILASMREPRIVLALFLVLLPFRRWSITRLVLFLISTISAISIIRAFIDSEPKCHPDNPLHNRISLVLQRAFYATSCLFLTSMLTCLSKPSIRIQTSLKNFAIISETQQLNISTAITPNETYEQDPSSSTKATPLSPDLTPTNIPPANPPPTLTTTPETSSNQHALSTLTTTGSKPPSVQPPEPLILSSLDSNGSSSTSPLENAPPDYTSYSEKILSAQPISVPSNAIIAAFSPTLSFLLSSTFSPTPFQSMSSLLCKSCLRLQTTLNSLLLMSSYLRLSCLELHGQVALTDSLTSKLCPSCVCQHNLGKTSRYPYPMPTSTSTTMHSWFRPKDGSDASKVTMEFLLEMCVSLMSNYLESNSNSNDTGLSLLRRSVEYCLDVIETYMGDPLHSQNPSKYSSISSSFRKSIADLGTRCSKPLSEQKPSASTINTQLVRLLERWHIGPFTKLGQLTAGMLCWGKLVGLIGMDDSMLKYSNISETKNQALLASKKGALGFFQNLVGNGFNDKRTFLKNLVPILNLLMASQLNGNSNSNEKLNYGAGDCHIESPPILSSSQTPITPESTAVCPVIPPLLLAKVSNAQDTKSTTLTAANLKSCQAQQSTTSCEQSNAENDDTTGSAHTTTSTSTSSTARPPLERVANIPASFDVSSTTTNLLNTSTHSSTECTNLATQQLIGNIPVVDSDDSSEDNPPTQVEEILIYDAEFQQIRLNIRHLHHRYLAAIENTHISFARHFGYPLDDAGPRCRTYYNSTQRDPDRLTPAEFDAYQLGLMDIHQGLFFKFGTIVINLLYLNAEQIDSLYEHYSAFESCSASALRRVRQSFGCNDEDELILFTPETPAECEAYSDYQTVSNILIIRFRSFLHYLVQVAQDTESSDEL